jgi:hypothetical protein
VAAAVTRSDPLTPGAAGPGWRVGFAGGDRTYQRGGRLAAYADVAFLIFRSGSKSLCVPRGRMGSASSEVRSWHDSFVRPAARVGPDFGVELPSDKPRASTVGCWGQTIRQRCVGRETQMTHLGLCGEEYRIAGSPSRIRSVCGFCVGSCVMIGI